jgi:signal peptidase II
MEKSGFMRSLIFMLKWIFLATIIFCLDQGSKWLILQRLDLDRVIQVIPGFNLVLTFNKGAAFGFLAQHSGWQRIFFIVLAILVAISILFWLYKLEDWEFLDGIALSMILGGALGNLLDRLYLGKVIDFIDLYYKDFHWYTFNIADTAICLGAAILVFTLFRGRQLF